MKRVRCTGTERHFFDGDTYQTCPHCGAPAEDGNEAVLPPPVFLNEINENATIPLSAITVADVPTGNRVASAMETEENAVSKPEKLPMPATDWGKSTTNAWKGGYEDDVKTISVYSKGKQEPAVGWLVAIEGAYYGKSFELIAGQNFIGRDRSSTVCVEEEISISRMKHAVVIFEPKQQLFFLMSGEGSGLTYCNENLVMGNVALKSYDRIQMGEAVFLFVPLCGENFQWSREDA